MARISVIIAASPHDVQADGIRASVALHDDLSVAADRVIGVDEIPAVLGAIPSTTPCALIVVGTDTIVRAAEAQWLEQRPQLVVLRVEVIGDLVRFALRDPHMSLVLDHLHELVQRAGADPSARISRLQLQLPSLDDTQSLRPVPAPLAERPLLDAARAWIEAILRRAGVRLPGDPAPAVAADATASDKETLLAAVERAEAGLDAALGRAQVASEPLLALHRRLSLTPLEFRFLLLALAPELHEHYQQGFAALLDEAGRRVGSVALNAGLLGDPVDVRRQLTVCGSLPRWQLLEASRGHALPAADEPLHLDRAVVAWLLGDAGALTRDPRLHRVLRIAAWPGARLIEPLADLQRAARQLQILQQPGSATRTDPDWLLFNGEQVATWRAVLERAADLLNQAPLRVQVDRLVQLEAAEIAETARRLARASRLLHAPLLLDATETDATAEGDRALRIALAELAATRCRAGILCTSPSHVIGLLAGGRAAVAPDSCLPELARRRSLRTAVHLLGAEASESLLNAVEQQIPLQADGWDRALSVARARASTRDTPAQLTRRFIGACRDVAAESLSNLASRLDPQCRLTDVVLPAERRQQLDQIVGSVRHARQVLELWRFGEQLAYGRGVTALFHGPSGTGKTMAALAVARELGSQVLRIDLSRVVSKYIGDTEKHIDVVFRDAAQCGAVLLIDEADALLGKRSEVRDAHDRYANIEVAFLLQRIESYDGVAVFTTNARQNLDPAFLRRLRFIVEFPRPDAEARESIWRQCLPEQSHELTSADFRQLARKVDMTGGHIRQITLQAAFLAAAADRKIRLEDVAHASRAELAKLGLPPIALVEAA